MMVVIGLQAVLPTSAGTSRQNIDYDGSWPSTSPAGWEHFNGQIGDAAFYQYALSDAQIQAHSRLVPEPASLALFGIGLVGLLQFARRRRK